VKKQVMTMHGPLNHQIRRNPKELGRGQGGTAWRRDLEKEQQTPWALKKMTQGKNGLGPTERRKGLGGGKEVGTINKKGTQRVQNAEKGKRLKGEAVPVEIIGTESATKWAPELVQNGNGRKKSVRLPRKGGRKTTREQLMTHRDRPERSKGSRGGVLGRYT